MKYDLIIVGGGIVGLSLALALARKTSYQIALLESQPLSCAWSKADDYQRVSAITLSSQRFFQDLDIWDAICEKRVSPFKQIEVWDQQNNNVYLNFNSAEIACSSLGFIIENRVIETTLLQKLQAYQQVKLISPLQLVEFVDDDQGVTLKSAQGEIFQAPFAVAADGALSWLRQKANIPLKTKANEQTALVTTLRTQLPHGEIARQVFLAEGPLAFLPLQEAHTSSLVWSLPTPLAIERLHLEDEIFKAQLTEAFKARLGDITTIHPRQAFPIREQEALHYVKSHVILVGDAAHVVHPLAGQGVNLGLSDVANLATLLINHARARDDIATFSLLRKYERWRKADNMAMLKVIETMQLATLRGASLRFAVSLPWLKNKLMRYAVGNRDGLPNGAS